MDGRTDERHLRRQQNARLPDQGNSRMTDHYLLLTATPHKRQRELPISSCHCSIRTSTGMSKSGAGNKRQEAVLSQKGERGACQLLIRRPEKLPAFRKRNVFTVPSILMPRGRFYDHLTAYVEKQSVRAAADGTIRSRAPRFTMACSSAGLLAHLTCAMPGGCNKRRNPP